MDCFGFCVFIVCIFIATLKPFATSTFKILFPKKMSIFWNLIMKWSDFNFLEIFRILDKDKTGAGDTSNVEVISIILFTMIFCMGIQYALNMLAHWKNAHCCLYINYLPWTIQLINIVYCWLIHVRWMLKTINHVTISRPKLVNFYLFSMFS